MSAKALALTALCLLAASTVKARELANTGRKLNQYVDFGGVYCNGGQGIAVVNTVIYEPGGTVVIIDTGRYYDGFNVYLAGGVLFGTVWGGVIFPPYYLPYFPQPIVTIVTIGPVFCQTVIINDNRPYFSQTVFYTDTGVRLFNPRGYYGQIYDGPSTYASRRAIGSFQQGNQGYIVASSPTIITSLTIVTNVPPRATTLAIIDPGLARAASLQANIAINANPGLTETRTAPPLAGIPLGTSALQPVGSNPPVGAPGVVALPPAAAEPLAPSARAQAPALAANANAPFTAPAATAPGSAVANAPSGAANAPGAAATAPGTAANAPGTAAANPPSALGANAPKQAVATAPGSAAVTPSSAANAPVNSVANAPGSAAGNAPKQAAIAPATAQAAKAPAAAANAVATPPTAGTSGSPSPATGSPSPTPVGASPSPSPTTSSPSPSPAAASPSPKPATTASPSPSPAAVTTSPSPAIGTGGTSPSPAAPKSPASPPPSNPSPSNPSPSNPSPSNPSPSNPSPSNPSPSNPSPSTPSPPASPKAAATPSPPAGGSTPSPPQAAGNGGRGTPAAAGGNPAAAGGSDTGVGGGVSPSPAGR